MRISAQRLTIVLATFACLLLLNVDSLGQKEAPAQTQPQQVRMTLVVTDRSNHIVEKVRQQDIQVSEDGLALKVTSLTNDQRPLRYAIALDTSGSFKFLLGPSILVAKTLIENKAPNDEVMLMRFASSDKIERVQDFTADRSSLLNSLKLLKTEGGQSAVVDAIYLAVDGTAEYQPDNSDVRRAVVLFSDGEDRVSFYTQDQLFKLLRDKDVQIFVIGMLTQLSKEGGFIRRPPREKAEKLLRRVAQETGGRVFFPNNGQELAEAMEEVYRSLNSQLLVEFERQTKPGEKGYRKINVSVGRSSNAEKLVAVTRPGYLVGPKEKTKDSKSRKK